MLSQNFQGLMENAKPAVIAASGTTSAALDLEGFSLVGIKVPAAFTGTALTFSVCDTLAGTYVPLKVTTSGTALSYTVSQGNYYAIDPKDFYGVRFLKIISGSTEGTQRTLLCSLKGI